MQTSRESNIEGVEEKKSEENLFDHYTTNFFEILKLKRESNKNYGHKELKQ